MSIFSEVFKGLGEIFSEKKIKFNAEKVPELICCSCCKTYMTGKSYNTHKQLKLNSHEETKKS